MKAKNSTEKQIIAVLREAVAGSKATDLCRKHRDIGADIQQMLSPQAKREGVRIMTSEHNFGVTRACGARPYLLMPLLVADLYVPGLIAGAFGSRRWMQQIGKIRGASRSSVRARASRENGSAAGVRKSASPLSVRRSLFNFPTPTRIYADFNGLVKSPRNSGRTAVVLDTFGSLRDLCNAGLILSEGLPLIAVDWSDEKEDLEGHGTAQYDRDRRWWVVEFDEMGVRYVPAGNRDPVKEFLCVACRRPLPVNAPSEAFNPTGRCRSCGISFTAPYAPPPLTT